MPNGKHDRRWELASQSIKEMDRDGEPAVTTATSDDSKAGQPMSREPEIVA